MEYERTPRGWNRNKTTQRKQDKPKLTKRSFHGIKFPKNFKLPRDNQNTRKQNPLGLGNPGASHQGARVTLQCLATLGHDKEVVGHALFF
jgi:hypothetical protein